MATQDKVTELFESIKHDLHSVKKMLTLCDSYIQSQEPDDNYPYFESKYAQKLNEYVSEMKQPNIMPMRITGYKYDCIECENCSENIYDISCYVNDCIRVNVHIFSNTILKRCASNIITISKSYDKDEATDIDLYIRDANAQYFNRLNEKYDWLRDELAKTGNTFAEFCIVLQALCS